MNKKILLISILAIIVISGCTEQKPLTEIRISGHEHVYTFRNDIRESINVPTTNEIEIAKLIMKCSELNIVFNGTSREDNQYIAVAVFDTVSRLLVYFANEGKAISFPVYYFNESGWFKENMSIPGLPYSKDSCYLWFIGPNTGAKETSVVLNGNIVYIQGTSFKNLTMAADKLSLIMMGINNIESITSAT
jgi:hypothetical protein